MEADDLYFIRANGGPCKIGRSRDVETRFRMTQTHCWDDLKLLGSLPGQGPMEKVWHKAFRAYRVRGEWFEWSRQLKRAINAALAGNEWIAELDPPLQYRVRAEREWKEGGPFPYHTNATAWAGTLWCERIADLEEQVLCEMV